LKAARKLIDGGGLSVLEKDNDGNSNVEVPGSGVTHLVRLRQDGDKCSCAWFNKHQGKRGPCKHILAARILLDDDSESGTAW
jgi:hypothetical protein